MPEPPRVVSWMAKMVASGLDTLFLSRFEAQRAEYWQTLYTSATMGPVLLLCSEDDELAPFRIVRNFAQHLQEQGGDVKLVKWSSSPHVGHYKRYPDEYRDAVFGLLAKAVGAYTRRALQDGGAAMMRSIDDQISESICNLRKAAASSNESFRRVATGPSDHFYLPSSQEYAEPRDVQDERRGASFQLQDPLAPGINPHGVLGQILFDVCVPKNVEGWDIKPVGSLSKTLPSARCPFNPIKCIRRSRL